VVAAEGDFEGAFQLFEESLEMFRRAGDEAGAARADWMMPIRDLVAGRWDGPVAKAEEAVDTWRRTGERFRLGDGLVWLAVVYARAGRPADARAAMAEARALFDDADSPLGMISVLLGLSYLARWEERYQDAVRLAGAADALRDQVGGRAPLDFLAGFLGDPEAEARAHLPPDVAQRAWREGRTSGVDAALASSAHAG
jgi:tetratricopeptide (TPR) repeat protein